MTGRNILFKTLVDAVEVAASLRGQNKTQRHSPQTPAFRSGLEPYGAPSAPCAADAACDRSFHFRIPWLRAGSWERK